MQNNKYLKDSIEKVMGIFNFSNDYKIGTFDIVRSPEIIEYYNGIKPDLNNFVSLQKKTCDKLLDLTFLYDEEVHEDKEFNWNGFVIKKDLFNTWISKRPFYDVTGLKEYIRKETDEICDWKPGEAWDWWGRRIEGEYKKYFFRATKDLSYATPIYASSPIFLDVMWYRASMDLFWYLFIENPTIIIKWWDAYIEHEIKRINSIADSNLSPIVFIDCDIGGKNRLLASPNFLRKEYFPRLKKIINTWKHYNYKIIYHSDGYIWEVLDDLVAAGIDALHPIDITAGMDLIKIRNKYPNLVLIGGIDVISLISYGLEEEVSNEVERIIKTIGKKGGLFLGSSLELNQASKLKNVIKMFESIKKFSSKI